jgi:excisionase family DNA binding protein
MTTKELAKYLKLHEITICKYAVEGRIPAIRIGRVWRFDKDAIDKWIGEGTPPANKADSKEAAKGAKITSTRA